MIDPVRSRPGAFAYLQGELLAPNGPGLDRLRLVEAPLVPEVRLHLAQDAIVWWARMEAEVGAVLTAPFWATAWPGGQALARYVLDRPGTVAGRQVLDVASGSGLVAIAIEHVVRPLVAEMGAVRRRRFGSGCLAMTWWNDGSG